MTSVRAVPEGYHSVTPYLAVDNAAAALEFYKQAFGARERMRMAAPGGKVGHAEIEIGGSCVMLADEYPDMGFRNPKAIGGTPVTLHLYVEDVDAVARQAVAAGARELRPGRTSSMATGVVRSRTPSATSGTSRPTRRTCRRAS
jgi:PhnB protein